MVKKLSKLNADCAAEDIKSAEWNRKARMDELEDAIYQTEEFIKAWKTEFRSVPQENLAALDTLIKARELLGDRLSASFWLGMNEPISNSLRALLLLERLSIEDVLAM